MAYGETFDMISVCIWFQYLFMTSYNFSAEFDFVHNLIRGYVSYIYYIYGVSYLNIVYYDIHVGKN